MTTGRVQVSTGSQYVMPSLVHGYEALLVNREGTAGLCVLWAYDDAGGGRCSPEAPMQGNPPSYLHLVSPITNDFDDLVTLVLPDFSEPATGRH